MYIPKHFAQNEPALLAEVIRQYSFGTLVSVVEQRPFATHLPFIYDQENGGLHAHMARSNPHWHALLEAPEEALVIFQGPHAYVSPSWYDSPGVPTWNYAAVHVYGFFQTIDDPEQHRQILERLTAVHEATQTNPWVADFDSPTVSQMIGGTVAFEISIKEIQGKFKLSQNRSPTDRVNVIETLENVGSDNASGVAEMMRRLT